MNSIIYCRDWCHGFYWCQYIFNQGKASFINGQENLSNSAQRNPPDGIDLGNCALLSFISADIFLMKTFLDFAFCSVLRNKSWDNSLFLKFSWFIHNVNPVSFYATDLRLYCWLFPVFLRLLLSLERTLVFFYCWNKRALTAIFSYTICIF